MIDRDICIQNSSYDSWRAMIETDYYSACVLKNHRLNLVLKSIWMFVGWQQIDVVDRICINLVAFAHGL